MIPRDKRRGDHRANRPLSDRLQAALGLGLVLSVGTLGTQAAWTDAVSVVGATFSTGSIDLTDNDLVTNTAYATIKG